MLMPTPASPLLDHLRRALLEQWPSGPSQPHRWERMHLEPLKAKGLAHDHVRIGDTGWLARIPKQSQMRLAASENLAYQRACFERASAAGHAPACVQVLQPCSSLPRGALIVQEIVGRPAQLPQDLPLMAASLAALHRLALPPAAQRAPLLSASDPLQAMWMEIAQQTTFLPQAGLSPPVATKIQAELAHLESLCRSQDRPLQRLIAFDGHPGNFVVAAHPARAFLVDLEKCRYSYPSFDLAHATLYTSTTWDVDSQTVLRPDEVLTAYRAWGQQVDAALVQDAQRWHLPLRRAMWLWSLTWCAKWRVASATARAAGSDGEDWSAQNIDARLAAHVRERVDHYLSAEGVAWVSAELETLNKHWKSA